MLVGRTLLSDTGGGTPLPVAFRSRKKRVDEYIGACRTGVSDPPQQQRLADELVTNAMKHISTLVCASMLSTLLLINGCTTTITDELSRGFVKPPDSAKPRTWWHWVSGNVSKEGITADLEAMKRIGVGGAQMFFVDQVPNQKDRGPVRYMSDTFAGIDG